MSIQVLSDDGCTILFDSRWKYPEEFGFTKGTAKYDEVKQMYYDKLHLALPYFEAIEAVLAVVRPGIRNEKQGKQLPSLEEKFAIKPVQS